MFASTINKINRYLERDKWMDCTNKQFRCGRYPNFGDVVYQKKSDGTFLKIPIDEITTPPPTHLYSFVGIIVIPASHTKITHRGLKCEGKDIVISRGYAANGGMHYSNVPQKLPYRDAVLFPSAGGVFDKWPSYKYTSFINYKNEELLRITGERAVFASDKETSKISVKNPNMGWTDLSTGVANGAYIPVPFLQDGTPNHQYYLSTRMPADYTGLGSQEIWPAYNVTPILVNCDFAGYENTKHEFDIHKYAQPNWNKDPDVLETTSVPKASCRPAAMCCVRHGSDVSSTPMHEWYLPSCGEWGYIMANLEKINEIGKKLNIKYLTGNPWSPIEYVDSYWTSTRGEYGAGVKTMMNAYKVNLTTGCVLVANDDDRCIARPCCAC